MGNLKRFMIIIIDENTYTYVSSFDTLPQAQEEVHKMERDDLSYQGYENEYKIIDLRNRIMKIIKHGNPEYMNCDDFQLECTNCGCVFVFDHTEIISQEKKR